MATQFNGWDMSPSYEVLIAEVERREELWNPESEHFRSRKACATAWQEVSELLHVPEHELRAKWKSLRTVFHKQYKQYYPQSLDEYRGKWRYFPKLWFLHRVYELQARDQNTYDSMGNVEAEYSDDPESEPELSESKNINDDDKRKRKRSRIDEDDPDNDWMFLKSLAPFFKRLEPLRKLVVRSKFQDILQTELARQAAADPASVTTTSTR
ncbi:hypothetical protein EVAR_44845_1 [Eumeta japonica]|uniref:MADF domain-containing protein n=1 Tax=Eumeta variegata TaxID=151549 RepID=A0A4C1YLW2_EUMVA|nr:hypothetical protein EVAR_44845_1 [Eumeta japonica]